MRFKNAMLPTWSFYGTLFLILGWYSAAATPAEAQCNTGSALKGFNAVYGKCSGSVNQGTFAMVDANQYSSSGDICAAILAIFNQYHSSNSNGVTVDARGFNAGQQQNCSQNPYPSTLAAQPSSSVVLLPSGTITIFAKWVLPTNARVIGEGPNLTILKAGFSGDMIDMGNSTLCPPPPNGHNDCPGISIEHLKLDGSSLAGVNGIVNLFGEELSYVDDVAFSNILPSSGSGGIALSLLTGYSYNSGPYTNLTMSNVKTCVNVNGPTDTRGIHGLTCSLSTGSSGPAIYLDGANNTLEDISINGTTSQDGIVIGSGAGPGSTQPAQNNVLFNIRGSGLGNLVHISKKTTNSSPPNCPAQADGNKYTVCDLTILGVTKSSGTNTIVDELTSTTLTDANVGMYIVGESVNGGSLPIGYSRFTTSPKVPTWLVGTANPPTTPCAVGSLYSEASGSGSSKTLYKCVGPSGSSAWVPVI